MGNSTSKNDDLEPSPSLQETVETSNTSPTEKKEQLQQQQTKISSISLPITMFPVAISALKDHEASTITNNLGICAHPFGTKDPTEFSEYDSQSECSYRFSDDVGERGRIDEISSSSSSAPPIPSNVDISGYQYDLYKNNENDETDETTNDAKEEKVKEKKKKKFQWGGIFSSRNNNKKKKKKSDKKDALRHVYPLSIASCSTENCNEVSSLPTTTRTTNTCDNTSLPPAISDLTSNSSRGLSGSSSQDDYEEHNNNNASNNDTGSVGSYIPSIYAIDDKNNINERESKGGTPLKETQEHGPSSSIIPQSPSNKNSGLLMIPPSPSPSSSSKKAKRVIKSSVSKMQMKHGRRTGVSVGMGMKNRQLNQTNIHKESLDNSILSDAAVPATTSNSVTSFAMDATTGENLSQKSQGSSAMQWDEECNDSSTHVANNLSLGKKRVVASRNDGKSDDSSRNTKNSLRNTAKRNEIFEPDDVITSAFDTVITADTTSTANLQKQQRRKRKGLFRGLKKKITFVIRVPKRGFTSSSSKKDNKNMSKDHVTSDSSKNDQFATNSSFHSFQSSTSLNSNLRDDNITSFPRLDDTNYNLSKNTCPLDPKTFGRLSTIMDTSYQSTVKNNDNSFLDTSYTPRSSEETPCTTSHQSNAASDTNTVVTEEVHDLPCSYDSSPNDEESVNEATSDVSGIILGAGGDDEGDERNASERNIENSQGYPNKPNLPLVRLGDLFADISVHTNNHNRSQYQHLDESDMISVDQDYDDQNGKYKTRNCIDISFGSDCNNDMSFGNKAGLGLLDDSIDDSIEKLLNNCDVGDTTKTVTSADVDDVKNFFSSSSSDGKTEKISVENEKEDVDFSLKRQPSSSSQDRVPTPITILNDNRHHPSFKNSPLPRGKETGAKRAPTSSSVSNLLPDLSMDDDDGDEFSLFLGENDTVNDQNEVEVSDVSKKGDGVTASALYQAVKMPEHTQPSENDKPSPVRAIEKEASVAALVPEPSITSSVQNGEITVEGHHIDDKNLPTSIQISSKKSSDRFNVRVTSSSTNTNLLDDTKDGIAPIDDSSHLEFNKVAFTKEALFNATFLFSDQARYGRRQSHQKKHGIINFNGNSDKAALITVEESNKRISSIVNGNRRLSSVNDSKQTFAVDPYSNHFDCDEEPTTGAPALPSELPSPSSFYSGVLDSRASFDSETVSEKSTKGSDSKQILKQSKILLSDPPSPSSIGSGILKSRNSFDSYLSSESSMKTLEADQTKSSVSKNDEYTEQNSINDITPTLDVSQTPKKDEMPLTRDSLAEILDGPSPENKGHRYSAITPMKTTSPLLRFQNAIRQFEKRNEDNRVSQRKSPPRKNASVNKGSFVFSRVTELDGRLRRNMQRSLKEERRLTSGKDAIAPRRPKLVNPLFRKLNDPEELIDEKPIKLKEAQGQLKSNAFPNRRQINIVEPGIFLPINQSAEGTEDQLSQITVDKRANKFVMQTENDRMNNKNDLKEKYQALDVEREKSQPEQIERKIRDETTAEVTGISSSVDINYPSEEQSLKSTEGDMVLSDFVHSDESKIIEKNRNEMTYDDSTYQRNVGKQGKDQGDEALKSIFNHRSIKEIERTGIQMRNESIGKTEIGSLNNETIEDDDNSMEENNNATRGKRVLGTNESITPGGEEILFRLAMQRQNCSHSNSSYKFSGNEVTVEAVNKSEEDKDISYDASSLDDSQESEDAFSKLMKRVSPKGNEQDLSFSDTGTGMKAGTRVSWSTDDVSIVDGQCDGTLQADEAEKENKNCVYSPTEDSLCSYSPLPLADSGKATVNPRAQQPPKSPSALCLSPIQRTPMQARKWRTLAAQAEAKKQSSTKMKKVVNRKKEKDTNKV